jgi:uncharacterized membrane protein YjgN (DUF898 family)
MVEFVITEELKYVHRKYGAAITEISVFFGDRGTAYGTSHFAIQPRSNTFIAENMRTAQLYGLCEFAIANSAMFNAFAFFFGWSRAQMRPAEKTDGRAEPGITHRETRK